MTITEILRSHRVGGWIEKLRSRAPLPPLVAGSDWSPGLTREINDTSHEEVCAGCAHPDHDLAICVKSGLLLWNDALESAHVLCQQVETSTGSYWHGILHRREPDFGNSKYWFHRVSRHPSFESLKTLVTEFLQSHGDGYAQSWLSEIQAKGWDPFQFVDRCEEAAHGREVPEIVEILERVQLLEIENLLAWTAGQAVGMTSE